MNMLQENYYYLISGFLDLTLDKSDFSDNISLQFKDELVEQLNSKDFNLAKLLYLQYDNINILNILSSNNKAFLKCGNYTQIELEEEIDDPVNLVDYLITFLSDKAYESNNISDKNKLHSLYYAYVLKTKNSFLKSWFRFEKDLNNLLIAFNCNKYGYNLEDHLVSVNNHNAVYDILVKGSINNDLLSNEFSHSNELIKIFDSRMNMYEKEKAIDLIKWKFIDELTEFDYFTIEKVFGYIIKLQIIERWNNMDAVEGKKLFQNLVQRLKTSYVFSNEYSLVKN